ncbi:uncharacterized protein LOC144003091 [Festucalex cinctus]
MRCNIKICISMISLTLILECGGHNCVFLSNVLSLVLPCSLAEWQLEKNVQFSSDLTPVDAAAGNFHEDARRKHEEASMSRRKRRSMKNPRSVAEPDQCVDSRPPAVMLDWRPCLGEAST